MPCLARFEGVIDPPPPLTLKRRELKRERARTSQEALGKLVEVGVTTPFLHSLGGAFRDETAPYTPRSLAFPVSLVEIDGALRLLLSTPATGDLPFVKRIEEVTGLRAEWLSSARSHYTLGQWHHAVDLADDAGWQRLAASMEHTTPEDVARAVGYHVVSGQLSVENGRALLEAVCEDEPADRSEAELVAMRPGSGPGPCMSPSGWGAVHAVEDGWLIVDKKRREARFTEKARLRLALDLPSPRPGARTPPPHTSTRRGSPPAAPA